MVDYCGNEKFPTDIVGGCTYTDLDALSTGNFPLGFRRSFYKTNSQTEKNFITRK